MNRKGLGVVVNRSPAPLVMLLILVAACSGSIGSGQAMPVGDLPGWRQIFTDGFTTDVPRGKFPTAVASRWSAYGGGASDTSGKGRYHPETVVSIANGVLTERLRAQAGQHPVAAILPSIPKGMVYGRYAIRFRADAVEHYKVAWLLWPDSEAWPRDGEIDFPEGDLTGNIEAHMHRQNGRSGDDQDTFHTETRFRSWHTAVIEWRPNSVRFILDGAVVGEVTSRVPATPMHWVIQTETSLGGGAPTTADTGNVQIDWVAVWKYVG